MMRTFTRRVSSPPTRSISPSCRMRSSLAWNEALLSPISSRNRVPPSASSKRPLRWRTAPVKAPFSWPNSSLSSRLSGSAAQLNLTKAAPARGEWWWMALAISSFPVPLSPRTSTVVSQRETWRITSTIWRIAGLLPTILSRPTPRDDEQAGGRSTFGGWRPGRVAEAGRIISRMVWAMRLATVSRKRVQAGSRSSWRAIGWAASTPMGRALGPISGTAINGRS